MCGQSKSAAKIKKKIKTMSKRCERKILWMWQKEGKYLCNINLRKFRSISIFLSATPLPGYGGSCCLSQLSICGLQERSVTCRTGGPTIPTVQASWRDRSFTSRGVQRDLHSYVPRPLWGGAPTPLSCRPQRTHIYHEVSSRKTLCSM